MRTEHWFRVSWSLRLLPFEVLYCTAEKTSYQGHKAEANDPTSSRSSTADQSYSLWQTKIILGNKILLTVNRHEEPREMIVQFVYAKSSTPLHTVPTLAHHNDIGRSIPSPREVRVHLGQVRRGDRRSVAFMHPLLEPCAQKMRTRATETHFRRVWAFALACLDPPPTQRPHPWC